MDQIRSLYVPSNFNPTTHCASRGPFGIGFEFATTVQHYYGHRAYLAFQIFYNIALQGSNIAAAIISAQVVDTFIAKVGTFSYALDFQSGSIARYSGSLQFNHTVSNSNTWCSGNITDSTCYGEQTTWVVSLGYIVCMIICIPFGYMNLDENMTFQWVSFFGLVIFTGMFFIAFILNMADPSADNIAYMTNKTQALLNRTAGSTFGNTPFYSPVGQADVVGICVFAYGYVVTICYLRRRPGFCEIHVASFDCVPIRKKRHSLQVRCNNPVLGERKKNRSEYQFCGVVAGNGWIDHEVRYRSFGRLGILKTR